MKLFSQSSRAGVRVLLVGVALVACSSSSPRAPFVVDESAPNEPEEDRTDEETTPATPVTPTPDVDSGGGSSVVDDDCKRAAPSLVCGLSPQCGCASTHTCDVVDAQGSVECITAGNATMGQPCTATAGCARGLTCIFGTCHPYCDTPNAQCSVPGTGTCAQVAMQNGMAVPNLAICQIACDLHDPMSCGGETNAGIGACLYDDDRGETDCQLGGTAGKDEACSESTACAPGFVCAMESSRFVCKRWCRMGQYDCGTGTSCLGFEPAVHVNGVTYGACP